jgi:hypothetical protein
MVRATEPLGRSDQLVDVNTIIGEKMIRSINRDAYHDRDGWPIHDTYHEIVLRSSAQCLPMVKFDRALQHHKEGRQCIQYLQDSLQQIIDRHFNEGMVSSDIHDAPIITTPVPTVRATLLSATWVPPRAAPAFLYFGGKGRSLAAPAPAVEIDASVLANDPFFAENDPELAAAIAASLSETTPVPKKELTPEERRAEMRTKRLAALGGR